MAHPHKRAFSVVNHCSCTSTLYNFSCGILEVRASALRDGLAKGPTDTQLQSLGICFPFAGPGNPPKRKIPRNREKLQNYPGPTTPLTLAIYYEALNDYTNNLQTALLWNRCTCKRKVLLEFPENSCVVRTFTESALWRRPNDTKEFLPECPVKDVLCSLDIFSETVRMCV